MSVSTSKLDLSEDPFMTSSSFGNGSFRLANPHIWYFSKHVNHALFQRCTTSRLTLLEKYIRIKSLLVNGGDIDDENISIYACFY